MLTINDQYIESGWVPLYKAVLFGDEQIVKPLLDYGADPNIKNNVILINYFFSLVTLL